MLGAPAPGVAQPRPAAPEGYRTRRNQGRKEQGKEAQASKKPGAEAKEGGAQVERKTSTTAQEQQN